MKNLGRGTTFEISSNVPDINIVLVKWYDKAYRISEFVGLTFIDIGSRSTHAELSALYVLPTF